MASGAGPAERVARLVEKEGYGVRHGLLDREAIGRLVARWKKQAAPGTGSRRDRMALLRLQTLAASTGNVRLYAGAALEGRSVHEQPLIGLQAAKQFVPAEAKVPSHGFDEYAESLGRAYAALGRAGDLRQLRQRFSATTRPRAPGALLGYLGSNGAENHYKEMIGD